MQPTIPTVLKCITLVIPDFRSCAVTKSIIACVLLVVAGGNSGSSAAAEPGEVVVNENESTLTVTSGGQTILTYNKRPPAVPPRIDRVFARDGFLHPVASPAGHIVTGLYPADHAHQNGFFSAWVNTTYDGREIDFWNLADRTGRVAHASVISKTQSSSGVRFEVELRHRIVTPPVVDVLNERWTITVGAPQTDDIDGQSLAYNTFDIESVQSALTDVPLIANEYRYGGFAYRGPANWLTVKGKAEPKNPAVTGVKTDIRNDADQNRRDANHRPTRWVVISGPAAITAGAVGENEGDPRARSSRSETEPAATVSVVVLSDPSNFRAPQTARIHPTKPYFCFSPCVDGKFEINKASPYRSAYRVLVVDGIPSQHWIGRQYESWAGQRAGR